METKLISPIQMDFALNLSKRVCYKRRTGFCSLDLDKDIEDKVHKHTNYCEAEGTWSYCRNLYRALLDGKGSDPKAIKIVEVAMCRCGHYIASDGQHRSCIAKRKDMSIYADVSDPLSKDCPVCNERGNKGNIINKIKQHFKKNETDSDTFIF